MSLHRRRQRILPAHLRADRVGGVIDTASRCDRPINVCGAVTPNEGSLALVPWPTRSNASGQVLAMPEHGQDARDTPPVPWPSWPCLSTGKMPVDTPGAGGRRHPTFGVCGPEETHTLRCSETPTLRTLSRPARRNFNSASSRARNPPINRMGGRVPGAAPTPPATLIGSLPREHEKNGGAGSRRLFLLFGNSLRLFLEPRRGEITKPGQRPISANLRVSYRQKPRSGDICGPRRKPWDPADPCGT